MIQVNNFMIMWSRSKDNDRKKWKCVQGYERKNPEKLGVLNFFGPTTTQNAFNRL